MDLFAPSKDFLEGFGMEGESAIRMRFWAAGAEGASDGGDGLGVETILDA